MSNLAKSNTDLYHHYKVLAPKLLEEIARLLITCRSLGIVMPRGMKNIFEFTWEELIMEPPSTSASKISGLDVCFGQVSSVELSFSAASRKPMTKNSPSPPAFIQPMPNSYRVLQKFQKKSLHLLSELLSLKLKMMTESSAGSSPMDVSKQFVKASQQLHLKAKEIILESILDTVGLGKGGNQSNIFTAIGVNSPYQLVFQSSNACLSFSLSGAKERRGSVLTRDSVMAEKAPGGISSLRRMVASGTRALVTSIFMTSLDVLKAFLRSQAMASDLYASVVAGAMAQLGTVTVINPLQLPSLYWFNYELVKMWLRKMPVKDQTLVSISFVAGAFSGPVTALLTPPFDVGKTQHQMELGSKQKLSVVDDSTGRLTGSSSSEPFLFNDLCLQAQGKLQEMCRIIEAEKNSWKGKRFSSPVILHNYSDKRSSSHSIIYKGDSKSFLHSTARPPYPVGHRSQILDTKSKRAFRFHYTFYDGTTFVFYPSGHIAVCQIPTCCKGRYTTCIFNDTPNFPIIGLFTAEGHGSVQYNLKNHYPCLFMMNHEGGCIKDTMGHAVHKWSWTSKKRTLTSLEYKMNEQIKLKIHSQDSISITFSALNENVTLVLSPTDCPHGAPPEKRYSYRSSAEERTSKMIRALVEIKKRFQKTVSQFMNSVLLSAGLLTIDYPVKDEIDLSRFKKKSPSSLQWIQKSASEPLSHTHSVLHNSSAGDSLWDDASSAVVSTSKKKPIKIPPTVPDRSKSAGVPDPRSSSTWAFALADCPLMLRKLLLRQDTSFGCRCLVKSPALTDVEFERFISAPRDPNQILVLYVMTIQSSANSSHLEWILDTLYLHSQCGRPSPCIQCQHDPYRLLRYNIHGALQEDPPLLVQKYAVTPGMILMFAGGKLLFGGFIFNGYECCSKKNLLKQIFLARQHCKMGYFLPDNFKFSTLSPFPQNLDNYKDQEEEEDEQQETKEMQPAREENKKKDLDALSTSKHMQLETLIESTPMDLKARRKSMVIQKRMSKWKK
uniref:Uncharacterized protein C3orf20 homolog n=1 Tax=Phascolarctos cinereus TaxID=38626 RepID=A0A6P5JSC1_PHACI|nr:uncharacterized protein C3orf20 homolog [Phascolarctos cinereus]